LREAGGLYNNGINADPTRVGVFVYLEVCGPRWAGYAYRYTLASNRVGLLVRSGGPPQPGPVQPFRRCFPGRVPRLGAPVLGCCASGCARV
jgi:hypothetical protein